MIELSNLSKKFGDACAVRDLTLRVPRGELFCFLGPNGAGKTTTLKMIAGLLRPTAGAVMVGGHDVVSDSMAVKKMIGYVPDYPYLYDRLTPREFFRFTGDLYDVPRQKVLDSESRLFQLFGLVSHEDFLIKELSHGMRQRLIYAATMLHDPQVLLIDEPLVGLDPYTIRLVKNLLRSRVKAGMTIFLTTHLLAFAEEIADRIGIIYEGRLIALGNMADLLAQCRSARTLEEVFLKLTGAPSLDPGMLETAGPSGNTV